MRHRMLVVAVASVLHRDIESDREDGWVQGMGLPIMDANRAQTEAYPAPSCHANRRCCPVEVEIAELLMAMS